MAGKVRRCEARRTCPSPFARDLEGCRDKASFLMWAGHLKEAAALLTVARRKAIRELEWRAVIARMQVHLETVLRHRPWLPPVSAKSVHTRLAQLGSPRCRPN
jgi:hypothetical protein